MFSATNRSPLRVLVLANAGALSGVLALTIARMLAVFGACVLVFSPSASDTGGTGVLREAYESELTLLQRLAPRPNPYGLDGDDDDDDLAEEEEYEAEAEYNGGGSCLTRSPACALSSNADSASDVTASPWPLDADALDDNPIHRMWISRMPGLRVLRRPSCELLLRLFFDDRCSNHRNGCRKGRVPISYRGYHSPSMVFQFLSDDVGIDMFLCSALI